MANKNTRDGEFLRDENGSAYVSLGNERNKCYAVIVKCGHCGGGYFVPIMFTTRSSSVQKAIEDIKMTPRVKREKPDCVLYAFETTELEKFIIDAINDHDPYLKNFVEKNSDMMLSRRVASRWDDEADVKTAEQYHEFDVLGRAFAPRWEGSKLIVPTRCNTKELLHECFSVAAVRFGFRKDDPFFPMLYFMQYGEENDLGIKLEDNVLSYNYMGESVSYSLDDKFIKYISRYGINHSTKKQDEYLYEDAGTVKKVSAIDRFNARLNKFKKMKESEKETEPGE